MQLEKLSAAAVNAIDNVTFIFDQIQHAKDVGAEIDYHVLAGNLIEVCDVMKAIITIGMVELHSATKKIEALEIALQPTKS